MDWYSFKRYDYVVKKGHPAEGPLFPGIPDETRVVLISSGDESGISADEINAVAAATALATTGTDLVLTVGKLPEDFSADYLPLQASFRKNGALHGRERHLPCGHQAGESTLRLLLAGVSR